MTLKSGSKVTRGHQNRRVSIRHLWFPINVPWWSYGPISHHF